MKSFKAILAGCLFIVITIVMMQLAMVFLNVGYNMLAKHFPFLNGISIYFRYLLAYPLLFIVLFMGGYLTAHLAQKKVVLHCLVVGAITVGVSMLSAVDYMVVTSTGVALVLLAVLTIMVGGVYWLKKHSFE